MNPHDLSNDELDRAIADSDARNLELARKVGELRGRLLATFEGLAADRDVLDSLRAKAWAEHAPSHRDRIRFDRAALQFSGVPGGWPQGVDGAAYVQSHVAPARDELLAQIDGTGPGGGGREQPSESVRALRAMLGE